MRGGRDEFVRGAYHREKTSFAKNSTHEKARVKAEQNNPVQIVKIFPARALYTSAGGASSLSKKSFTSSSASRISGIAARSRYMRIRVKFPSLSFRFSQTDR